MEYTNEVLLHTVAPSFCVHAEIDTPPHELVQATSAIYICGYVYLAGLNFALFIHPSPESGRPMGFKPKTHAGVEIPPLHQKGQLRGPVVVVLKVEKDAEHPGWLERDEAEAATSSNSSRPQGAKEEAPGL